jgi:uracil-DNA glycosylase family 4
MKLAELKEEISFCRICTGLIPHTPRPVVRFSDTCSILIVGQAPGNKVHKSGIPWSDASGERLRNWMGINQDDFYNDSKIAIVPMAFCFPGINAKGGDNPPPPICAPLWHPQVNSFLPKVKLIILVGWFAQQYYLKAQVKSSLTETMLNWRNYGDKTIPLPHPSWRNTGWIKKNLWFTEEVLPHLKQQVKLWL